MEILAAGIRIQAGSRSLARVASVTWRSLVGLEDRGAPANMQQEASGARGTSRTRAEVTVSGKLLITEG